MHKSLSLDLTTIPKELRLILEIMKTENNDNMGSFNNKWFTGIEWDLFIQLTMHHRVYPLIYTKLIKVDKKLIPKYILQTLYQEYKKNTFQMLQLSGEMEQISRLFSENQIRLLFLKGPAIAADIYGDISLRTSKDLDVLIPINNLEKAEKLLLSLGYEKEEIPNVLNEWKWRYHHVTYFHPQKNIQIEIHWRLEPRPSMEPTFNQLWGQKRVSTITSYPVYILGKEDLFLYLISHGARHGWFRLRWLVDIDQMLRKGFDLEKTNIILKNHRKRHLGGQALILTSTLLDTPINDKMKILTEGSRSKKLAQMAIFFIKEKMPLHIITSTNYYRRYLFSLQSSNLQRILRIMILFYPSSTDVTTLRLPKHLHLCYFPLRPFLWAWRNLNKNRGYH